MIVLAFAGNLSDVEEPRDMLFRYSTALVTIIGYGVLAVPVLLIMRGTQCRELLALRRPPAWGWALGAGLAILVADYAFEIAYDGVLGPFDEGSLPGFWDSSRTGQLLASFVAIAVLAPIAEELMFRGLGYGLLERFGRWNAVLITGVLFALVHGYVVVLPVFVAFGIALGWLRSRTGSVYPGMVVHGVTNAAAIIFTVASVGGTPACQTPPGVTWQQPTGSSGTFVVPATDSQLGCDSGTRR